MTRSRSHGSPEPSEHPGAGGTAISLSFWVGNHRAQGAVHRKETSQESQCCAACLLHGDTQKVPRVRDSDGSKGRLSVTETAAPGPACSCNLSSKDGICVC